MRTEIYSGIARSSLR